MVSHVIVSRWFGKIRLTLSLMCTYGGGRVHYVGSTILMNNVYLFELNHNFFLSWFLRDGNVVSFSVMIFFINSKFILSSVNIYFVVRGFWAFPLSGFCFSIRLGGGSCFSVFGVSIYLYTTLFICLHISESQHFFIFVQSWAASLVIWNLVNLAQISIILFFLYPFVLKIDFCCLLKSIFSVDVSLLGSCQGPCLCTLNYNSPHLQDVQFVPILAIKGAPADHHS